MPVAENLARARAETGLDQDDVASALGVSRAMVSYWERGHRTPNDRQLAALSRVLHTPIGVLLGAQEPARDPDLSAVLMRGAGREVPDRAHAGLRGFVEFLDTYAELAAAARFPIRGMHESPFVSGAGFESAEDARRKAEEVRAHLRIGLGPIGDLDALCALLGVTVYQAPLGPDLSSTVSGAFYSHPVVGFSILVNLDMTPGRRRFTIAHELAHALFDSASERYTVSTSAKTPRERFADRFAGEFLMPTEGVRRVMEEHGFGPSIEDPAEVIHLQRFFGVSYITALVRLRQSAFLTRERFERFKGIRPVLLARSLGFDVSDDDHGPRRAPQHLGRFPARFRWLLRAAVQRGVLSVPSAAALTQASIDEITELASPDIDTSGPTEEERAELGEYEASGILGVA